MGGDDDVDAAVGVGVLAGGISVSGCGGLGLGRWRWWCESGVLPDAEGFIEGVEAVACMGGRVGEGLLAAFGGAGVEGEGVGDVAGLL